ncbi:MAG: DUF4112 domain-containing protein [Acidobacteriota bacterium]
MASQKIHIPEVIEADDKLPKDLVALRRFAFYMDEAFTIPGTNFKVGADALLGLIPWAGDVIGALLSTWIVIGALRHRVPWRIIFRMIVNIGIDLLVGAVPVAGDVFDFLYEENVKNMRLLEKHRDRRKPPRSTAGIAFVATFVVLLVLAMAGAMIAGTLLLALWLIGKRPLF